MTDSVLPRRRLGRRLRESRCAAGLTIAEAADRMQWSFAMLQRVEKGRVDKVREVDVRELCRIYGVDPDDLIDLSHEGDAPAWWRDFADLLPEKFDLYLGLESVVDRVAVYQSEVIPEIVRTARYERTLACSPADPDRRMRFRELRREPFFRENDPVRAEFVLDEAVLRRVVGSRAVMAAQCAALAEYSARANLSIRVVPFTVGYPANRPVGPFTILDFGKDGQNKRVEPTVIRLETFTGAAHLDKPRAVASYEKVFATLRAAALDAEGSRECLAELADEYARDP